MVRPGGVERQLKDAEMELRYAEMELRDAEMELKDAETLRDTEMKPRDVEMSRIGVTMRHATGVDAYSCLAQLNLSRQISRAISSC